jgi:hypothetical protein
MYVWFIFPLLTWRCFGRVEEAHRPIADTLEAHRYRSSRHVEALPPQLRSLLALDLEQHCGGGVSQPPGLLRSLGAASGTVLSLVRDPPALRLLRDQHQRISVQGRPSSSAGAGVPLVGGGGGGAAPTPRVLLGGAGGRPWRGAGAGGCLPPPPPGESVHWGLLQRGGALVCAACGCPALQPLRGQQHVGRRLVVLPSNHVYHDVCFPYGPGVE